MNTKIKLLTVFFSAGAIAFASACNTAPTTITNQNTAVVRSNAAVSVSGSLMNGNAMTNTDGMPMNHSEMKGSPNAATAPYDLQYLDSMSMHHQGGVMMAQMAVEKTKNLELKAFAQKMIVDQNREIAEMKNWREKWFAGKPMAMNMEMTGMGGSMKEMDMRKLQSSSGKEFDLEFFNQMIPHHEGAVTMAKESLTKAEHPEIKTLSNQIIKTQEAEIKQMAEWKAEWTK